MCIKIHFYLFIVAIYFYAIHKLQLFVMFYSYALLHELAHIIISLVLNVKIVEVILMPIGVCAKYGYINNKIKEIIIAAVGPLFSIIVFALTEETIIKEINLSIAILNLTPIYPLDGGRIIRGIIEVIWGYKKSVLASNCIAKVFLAVLGISGIIITIVFKNFFLITLGIYIFFIIKEENKKDRIKEIINDIVG